jgi:pantoate--beta-alanine ligase
MNQPFRPSDMNMLTTRRAAGLADITGRWKEAGLTIGFVPTMGALHEGHLSLVKIALERADRVVASIFVNPAQFAPHEDFEAYPREEDRDLARLAHSGTHLVYLPGEKDIYPQGQETKIRPGPPAEGLETDFRPHFFGGVANVVHRLFEQVSPDIAVFGEKDYQQLQVIKDMVATNKMPVEIIGGPVIRDEQGLALSSRNAYLSPEELKIARTLNKILFETASKISSSLRAKRSNLEIASSPALLAMTEEAKERLLQNGFDRVDYVAARWDRLLAAVWIGKTRLIDNVEIKKAAE